MNWVLIAVIAFVCGFALGGFTAWIVFGSYGGGQTSG